MSTKTILGGALAIAVLVLYCYAVVTAILIVNCVSQPACTDRKLSDFNDGLTFLMTTGGGLVSALAIAQLAITKPGETPVAHAAADTGDIIAKRIAQAVTLIYLFVWFGAGLVSLIFGWLTHPDVLEPLTVIGKSWLGLAVAAVFSYFGISPGTK